MWAKFPAAPASPPVKQDWYNFCRDVTNGFQLYQSDPSGNYGGWKATAIGANSQGAQNILKQDFKDEITLEEATKLIVKVLLAIGIQWGTVSPAYVKADLQAFLSMLSHPCSIVLGQSCPLQTCIFAHTQAAAQ